jgi:DNA polymerase I-like protein with 3'-5' exonuclease and polymerase domains
VGESPFLSNIFLLGNHSGWTYDIERTVLSSFSLINERKGNMEGRFTYAVRCQAEKPNAKEIGACAPNLVQELLEYGTPNRPLCIFVMGAAGLKSLGVQFKKYTEVIGKTIETTVGGHRAYVFVSLSKRQLATKAGYSEILNRQIEVFLDMVQRNRNGELESRRSILSRLSEEYRYPKTIEELDSLVTEIVGYSLPGEAVENSPISIDTETNTLYPHRNKLKLLMVSVCWGVGKAAAIQLEHSESSIEIEEARPHLERLLSCNKPKLFANAKYDLKVLTRKGFNIPRIAWDVMLGEHLIEEDKKGFYGLKSITRLRLPEFAAYEDELREIYAGRMDNDSLIPAPAIEETEEELLLKQVKPKKEKKKKKNADEPKRSRLEKKLAEDDGYRDVPLRELMKYAAFDADVTFRISSQQRIELTNETNTLIKKRQPFKLNTAVHGRKIGETLCPIPNPPHYNMARRIIPTTRVLAKMELHGMAVDRDYILHLQSEMDRYLANSSTLFSDMLPIGLSDFNPASTQHVAKALFSTGYLQPGTGELVCYAGKIEPPRTEKGAISTDAKFLKFLTNTHKCALSAALLEFRGISKARSTFIENIEVLSREDGRMHSNFHQHGTATARLSSSEENMQNIPKRIGKPPHQYHIKRIFIPTRPDFIIVNADAKAAEVRVYAAYSHDRALIQALNAGMDPHSFFASIVYKVQNVLQDIPPARYAEVLSTIGIDQDHAWSYEDFEARDIIKKMDKAYGEQLDALRKNIKRVVFGILYGAAPKKIAGIVGIPEDQAQVIIKTLFNMFPSIADYIKLTKDQVSHLNIVETFLGRRRHLNTKSLPNYMKSRAERQAVNFKIQNTSAEMVLDVLCATDPIIETDFGGNMLNTVHDSLVFQIPKKYVHQMPAFIQDYGVKQVAKKYPWLPVPFSWDVEVGANYGDLMSVASFLSNNPELTTGDEDDYMDLEIRNALAEEATAEHQAA